MRRPLPLSAKDARDTPDAGCFAGAREQNGDRQLVALRETTVPEQNIFADKQPGKDFSRPQYKKLVKN